jgi:NAD(P)H dehydrogenase (quinone)
MTIAITGVTGHFGRLVVESLLARDVPADQIVATGRDVSKIADLADRGVRTQASDYSDLDSLRQVLADADRLLLVSGSEVGQRVEQHRNAIQAAKEAGVGLTAYTSIANAGRTSMQMAAEHQATEQVLADSGLPFALLRNSWYIENYTAQLPTYLEYGAVLGSAGDGRVSAATRADYAEAAAAVMIGEDQAGKIYELGGDDAFTMGELAEEISRASGRQVTYQDLPVDEYTQVLVKAGLPEPYAAALADSDRGIARGDLLVTSGDLSRLIGHSTTSMPEAVQAAVNAATTAG